MKKKEKQPVKNNVSSITQLTESLVSSSGESVASMKSLLVSNINGVFSGSSISSNQPPPPSSKRRNNNRNDDGVIDNVKHVIEISRKYGYRGRRFYRDAKDFD